MRDYKFALDPIMPKTKKTTEINLSDPALLQELSWLEFNNRVLHEACDPH